MSPIGDERRARPAGAPRGGVRLLPPGRRPDGGLRGEAHGLARGRDRLPGRGGRAPALRRRRRGHRRLLHAHRPALLRRRCARGRAARRAFATPSTAAGCWSELETDWLLPRLRADAVVGEGAGAARASSTRPSAPPPGPALAETRRRARAAQPQRRSRRRRRCSSASASAPRTRGRYVEAYRRYCWPVASIDDLKLAPFHLLASEGASTSTRTTSGTWRRSPSSAPRIALLHPDRLHGRSTLTDPAEPGRGCAWWEELTGRGGEGMVVKPLDFIARGRRGPRAAGGEDAAGASTCASSTAPSTPQPANLERLRARGLGAKRSLALREFALGHRGAGALRARRAAAARARVRLRRAGAGERAGGPAALRLRGSSPSGIAGGRAAGTPSSTGCSCSGGIPSASKTSPRPKASTAAMPQPGRYRPSCTKSRLPPRTPFFRIARPWPAATTTSLATTSARSRPSLSARPHRAPAARRAAIPHSTRRCATGA